MINTRRPDEIFTWRDIPIIQRNEVFKVGTDALCLGGWVADVVDDRPLSIVDIGTGTGVLALMMAYYFPNAKISAIDRDAAAIELASINFRNSKWSDRLSAAQKDIFLHSNHRDDKYDLIVCNPPFFYKKIEASDEVKANAKHAESSPKDWMEVLVNNLNPDGHLCLVIPHEDAFRWIEAANSQGAYCRHRLNLHSFQKDETPVRTLLHFRAGLDVPAITNMNIYDKYKTYSQQYIDLTGIQPNAGL